MYLEKIKLINSKKSIEIYLDVDTDDSIIDDVLFEINSLLSSISKNNQMFAEIVGNDFKEIESNFKIISTITDSKKRKPILKGISFNSRNEYYINKLSLNRGLFSCLFGDIYIYSNETVWNDFLMKKNKTKDPSLILEFSFNDIGNFHFKMIKNPNIENEVKHFLKKLENLGFIINEKRLII